MKTYTTISTFDLLSTTEKYSALTEIGQAVVNSLIQAVYNRFVKPMFSGSEPRILAKRDRYGHLFWQVYDPVTNCSAAFDSERDVMVWIEERYRG